MRSATACGRQHTTLMRARAAEWAAIGIGWRHVADAPGVGVRPGARCGRRPRAPCPCSSRRGRNGRASRRAPRPLPDAWRAMRTAFSLASAPPSVKNTQSALESRQLEQPLRQILSRPGAPGARHETEPVGLRLDRGDQPRVLVAEIAALDEARHVEQFAAALEQQPGAAAADHASGHPSRPARTSYAARIRVRRASADCLNPSPTAPAREFTCAGRRAGAVCRHAPPGQFARPPAAAIADDPVALALWRAGAGNACRTRYADAGRARRACRHDGSRASHADARGTTCRLLR